MTFQELPQINTSQALADFADVFGLRADWHEPDEQGIAAEIIGTHLDNAMGPNTRARGESHCEFNVILKHHGKEVAVTNLATILSWGAQLGAIRRANPLRRA